MLTFSHNLGRTKAAGLVYGCYGKPNCISNIPYGPKVLAEQRCSQSQRIGRQCLPKTPSRTTSEAIVDSTFPSRRMRVPSWIWGRETRKYGRERKRKEEQRLRVKRETAHLAVFTTISLSPPTIKPLFRQWMATGKKNWLGAAIRYCMYIYLGSAELALKVHELRYKQYREVCTRAPPSPDGM